MITERKRSFGLSPVKVFFADINSVLSVFPSIAYARPPIISNPKTKVHTNTSLSNLVIHSFLPWLI